MPGELVIAYWSWGGRMPSTEEIDLARSLTGAREVFVLAGQIDRTDELKLIREPKGNPPANTPVHLVYNATPSLLQSLEDIDPKHLGNFIAAAYSDSVQGETSPIIGLQLDLDFPTRLLPRYAELLRHVRAALPPSTKLSITGLPTWMSSGDLGLVLGEVDFWAPQFYGDTVPQYIGSLTPISSTAEVRRGVAAARRLGKPFYAGLSVYGMALHYSKSGALIEIRGNIAPESALGSGGLKLVESGSFGEDGDGAERFYKFAAVFQTVIEGLSIEEGEHLVFIQPSIGSLRRSVAAVREEGGENLLGICLFRLRLHGDATTLSPLEVAAAVENKETTFGLASSLKRLEGHRGLLTISNSGNAASLVGEGAFVLDIPVNDQGVAGIVSYEGFGSVEPICRETKRTSPCSVRRANVFRLKANRWRPGSQAVVEVNFGPEATGRELMALATLRSDDGRVIVETVQSVSK